MKERFFLDGIDLDPADVSERNAELAAFVVADLADAPTACTDDATVTAGETLYLTIGTLAIENPGLGQFVEVFIERLHLWGYFWHVIILLL